MTVPYRLDPWPNGLGVSVYLDDVQFAEILCDPVAKGMRVTTLDAEGNPDLTLTLARKTDPLKALEKCLREGQPVEAP